MIFWGTFLIAIGVVTCWSLYAKYFGHSKYRGVRIINWTRAQRDESRDRRRRWEIEGK